MRFALVQRSLDAGISREDMEEASRAVPAVARADCARLHRDLFGIVVRNLDEENARTFSAELRSRGLETDVVPDADLPRLVPSRRGRGLEIGSRGGVVETDIYGRATEHPADVWVFAAAGYVVRQAEKKETRLRAPNRPVISRGHIRPQVLEIVSKTRWEEERTFHLECFFAREPMRVEWGVDDRGGLLLEGRVLRLREADRLHGLVERIRSRLPANRLNRGVSMGLEAAPVYPGLRAFEEEVIWHLYRLRGGRGA